jgi:hypothetical protein
MTYVQATVQHRELKHLRKIGLCRQRHVAQLARERDKARKEGKK